MTDTLSFFRFQCHLTFDSVSAARLPISALSALRCYSYCLNAAVFATVLLQSLYLRNGWKLWIKHIYFRISLGRDKNVWYNKANRRCSVKTSNVIAGPSAWVCYHLCKVNMSCYIQYSWCMFTVCQITSFVLIQNLALLFWWPETRLLQRKHGLLSQSTLRGYEVC